MALKHEASKVNWVQSIFYNFPFPFVLEDAPPITYIKEKRKKVIQTIYIQGELKIVCGL